MLSLGQHRPVVGLFEDPGQRPQKSVVMTTRVNLDRIGDDGSASPLSVSWPWPKPLSLEQA